MSRAALLAGLVACWSMGPGPGAHADGPQDSGSGPSVRTAAGKPTFDLYGDPLPRGAVSRLGSIRYRAQDSIQDVGLLPGELVVVTPGHGLRHYEATTGKLRRKVPVGIPYVNSSAMTQDRKWLALTGFHLDERQARYLYYLHVLDVATGKPRLGVERPEPLGESVAIADDGLTVATLEERGHLHIWDVAAGAEILDYQLNGFGQTRSMAFSPDSSTLAIGGDEVVALWRWSDGEEPKTISVKEARSTRSVHRLAFSPDGATLALASQGSSGVLLLDVASRKVAAELEADEPRGHYTPGLAFSPDGSRLAVIRDRNRGGGVSLWDQRARRLVRTLATSFSGATSLSFAPDGRMLAAASRWENTLDLWDVETGRRQTDGTVGHETGPGFIRFFEGDRRIATAGDDGTIRVWDAGTGRQVALMSHRDGAPPGTTPWIRGFAVSPDGRLAASSSLDDTVRVWDMATLREAYRLPGHGRLGGYRALGFTSDGRRLVSWGDDMQVYLWDMATGKAIEEYVPGAEGLPASDAGGRPARELDMGASTLGRLSSDGSRLLLGGDVIQVYDTARGRALPGLPPQQGYLIDMALSPDDRLVLTSRWGRPVVTNLADGRTHHSSEKNHTIALRRIEGGGMVKEIVLPEGGAGPVAFSADGSRFAIGVGVADPMIRIFDLSTGEDRGRITGFESEPRCMAFSQDGELLAAGMRNGTALVWATSRAVQTLSPSGPR